ncbi:hypothetical protein PN462_05065 [Spirulina sp. CS-785/01]|uniref:hypothetical protein n=1 Tax=Spirulina sp. CS-785/01 TaxID=3021716 RepID=UPI00232CFF36|nr:hypothetical protein [Spirulina sp. CS-785/01]MDB9312466.1 hypothetical protein [Spirulina sp. CS-785/01]
MKNTKQLILDELNHIPEANLEQILQYIREYKANLQPTKQTPKAIWEVADDLINAVPEEVWEQLPKDGAVQHDTYLYSQNND